MCAQKHKDYPAQPHLCSPIVLIRDHKWSSFLKCIGRQHGVMETTWASDRTEFESYLYLLPHCFPTGAYFNFPLPHFPYLKLPSQSLAHTKS